MAGGRQASESLFWPKIFRKFPVPALETGFARLFPPPSSPTKPQIPAPTSDRPFLWGFSPVSFPAFGLRRPLRPIRLIFGLQSLHQKIPFPAAGSLTANAGRLPGISGVLKAKDASF